MNLTAFTPGALRLALLAPLVCSLALTSALWPTGSIAAGTLQGSGTVATETRTVPDFQAIATSGSMDLNVRQGAQQSVQVQADDNLLAQLETVVESGQHGATLVVRWKKGTEIYGRSKVVVTVVASRLTGLTSAGSGSVRVDAFNTPALQLTMSGSGDARLDGLTTDELGVRLSGSGDVVGKGSAARLKVGIAGSGDVRLAEMRSDEVSVQIAGSGDAAVNAQKTLVVSIAGSGDVTYTGNAAVKSSVAGSGSVRRK